MVFLSVSQSQTLCKVFVYLLGVSDFFKMYPLLPTSGGNLMTFRSDTVTGRGHSDRLKTDRDRLDVCVHIFVFPCMPLLVCVRER